MRTLIDISEDYRKYSVKEAGMGYLSPVLGPYMALRYIADCLESGHELLGIEGFHILNGKKIQPDQSLDVDCEGFDETREFLKKVGEVLVGCVYDDVVFEIVFKSREG